MSDDDDAKMDETEHLQGRLLGLCDENARQLGEIARLRAEVSRLSGQRLPRLPRSETAPVIDSELLQGKSCARCAELEEHLRARMACHECASATKKEPCHPRCRWLETKRLVDRTRETEGEGR